MSLLIEIARDGRWKRINTMVPGEPPGSLSHNPTEGPRQMIIFTCHGDHSMIERSAGGADQEAGNGRVILSTGTEPIARLGNGEKIELIVRTDQGTTARLRFRHQGPK